MRKRDLGEGEEVALELRAHRKVLVVPALVVVGVVGIASYAAFAVPAGRWHRAGQLAVMVVAAGLVGWWSVRPYLRWRTTTFVLTNRRLTVRSGLLSRSGRDLPLHRITDVSFTHSLLERMLGCGTLTVESAGERGQLVLADIPDVEAVQREVYRRAEVEERRRRDRPDPASSSTG